ncbi:transcription initiation factor TFIID subunit 7, putative [Plasmodium gallinaceum]|uniref:Transcription initiation factor TFIID subunit 7, putative n=1 Tax=Plasmodium gallinaceum TaxID=5849 RepID=A0A1J1H0N0_PLAGA|nr:transcription initiation factor TFIID subunit 7, putative [Plasmodium gallinaceum]CRG96837.1 transcription initiation factor TFIID subunit 7, putative [Plasmodium gallinaceum]
MEKKNPNFKKISININTKKDENDLNEQNIESNESKVKSNSKEIIQTLNTIENIRKGTFEYEDLQEIYFMNDLDLLNIINDAKCREDKMKNKDNINNVYMLDSDVDKVCIIRFPPSVSKKIKKHLLKKNLELEIEPTNLLNSRFFIINFKNINKKYYGILVELATHIEIHKTLDGINLYKTSDVSQMIYVYENNKNSKKLLRKFINNNFQLNCGISNKTNNFNFQNYAKLYKYHDIYFAQKLIYEYLNSDFYDYYDIYVKTYNEMLNHISNEKENNKQNEIVDELTDLSEILSSLDNTYNLMNQIEKENGDINFEALLNYEIENENYESDVSDLLLGGNHYLKKKH